MPYVLSCRKAGMDCDYEAWAETKEELMELAEAHGKDAHGIEKITPELNEKIQGAIQEV